MVESPDTKRAERTRPFRPRLLPVVAAALIAIGGLAVLPSQNPIEEAASSEEVADSFTEASLLVFPASPVQVAESFMQAWTVGDGEAAAAMFTPNGRFYSDFGEYEPGMLPVLRDWYRAVGQHYQNEGCEPRISPAVACRYTFENKLTRILGRDRMMRSFRLLIDSVRIKRGWDEAYNDTFAYRYAVWTLFLNWVKFRDEADFERMYNPNTSAILLGPTSIELWEIYTDEFVAFVPYFAETEAICQAATEKLFAVLTGIDSEIGGPPGPFPILAVLAARRDAAVQIWEQVVAEMRAHPPPGSDPTQFEEYISIWEAHTEFLRQLGATVSISDAVSAAKLGQQLGAGLLVGPSICPGDL